MCQRALPASAFGRRVDRRYREPVLRLRPYCAQCQNEYDRALYRARYRSDPAFRHHELRRCRTRRKQQSRDFQEYRRQCHAAAQRHIARLLESGETFTSIAEAIGVFRTTVSRWYAGKCAPRPYRLRALRALVSNQTNGQTHEIHARNG